MAYRIYAWASFTTLCAGWTRCSRALPANRDLGNGNAAAKMGHQWTQVLLLHTVAAHLVGYGIDLVDVLR